MAEQPLHVAVLQLLERKVLERRTQQLETFAKGLPRKEYWKTVGRVAESGQLAELIQEMLKRIREDELDFDEEGTDDEDIGARAPARRTRQLTTRARTRG